MRRKSLDTVADLFAQQVELTTEQLNGCVDFAQNNFGPSPPSGLLVSWWQTFWEVLCFRQANPTMVSMVQGHQQIVNTQQPPMPILSDADAQRLRLQLALSSTGILGRDLNALGPTERNLLSNTLQQYVLLTTSHVTFLPIYFFSRKIFPFSSS